MKTIEGKYEVKVEPTELEKEGLEMFEEAIVKAAKENFMRDGSLNPMIFLGLVRDGELTAAVMPVGMFMENTQSKDLLENMMKKLGEKLDPVFIAMVMEGWVSEMPAKTSREELQKRYKEMPPSKDPDRKEMIILTFETENIQANHMLEIKREPELRLEPYKESDTSNGKMEGRFVNILRDMKKIKQN